MTVREELCAELIRAGELLANCAFNLKHKATLSERDCEVLAECQSEWDRRWVKLRDYDALLKAPRNPPVTIGERLDGGGR